MVVYIRIAAAVKQNLLISDNKIILLNFFIDRKLPSVAREKCKKTQLFEHIDLLSFFDCVIFIFAICPIMHNRTNISGESQNGQTPGFD